MKRRCSDKRLMQLVRAALYALEDPAKGFVFDDFDLRYREKEQKREVDSARWFYRDKTSFETKYGEECGRNGEEPAWVSDGGKGAESAIGIVSYALHGNEDCEDDVKKPGSRASDWNRRRKSALERVRRQLPHALKTLKLIIRNRDNRKESICSLVKSLLATRKNGNSRGKSTSATSTTSPGSSSAGR